MVLQPYSSCLPTFWSWCSALLHGRSQCASMPSCWHFGQCLLHQRYFSELMCSCRWHLPLSWRTESKWGSLLSPRSVSFWLARNHCSSCNGGSERSHLHTKLRWEVWRRWLAAKQSIGSSCYVTENSALSWQKRARPGPSTRQWLSEGAWVWYMKHLWLGHQSMLCKLGRSLCSWRTWMT